jgi:ketosteroid isomerase-like protein
MQPFRAAIEARDMDAVPALLAPDVTFRSPVAFAPYEGRELVAAILRAVERVFDTFAYEREMRGDDGRDVALEFRATIGEREVHGCDFLRLDDDGLIAELCVMVRPASAQQALAVAMGAQFERIGREVAG